MKQFAILTLISAAFASIGSAAACQTNAINIFGNGNGSAQVTCNVVAPVGTYIDNITINGIGDLSNFATGTQVNLALTGFTFTPTGTSNGIVTALSTPVILTGTQQLSTGGLAGNSDSSLTAASFTFTVTSTLITGKVDAATFNLNGLVGTSGNSGSGCGAGNLGCVAGAFQSGIFFTYAEPRNPVPEPATLGLVGGALLGIGLMRRRKR